MQRKISWIPEILVLNVFIIWYAYQMKILGLDWKIDGYEVQWRLSLLCIFAIVLDLLNHPMWFRSKDRNADDENTK